MLSCVAGPARDWMKETLNELQAQVLPRLVFTECLKCAATGLRLGLNCSVEASQSLRWGCSEDPHLTGR